MTDSHLEIRAQESRKHLELEDISGIWWRRPHPPAIKYGQDRPQNLLTVVRDERRSALIGSLNGLIQNSFNDPSRSRQASHKPTQLVRARHLGFKIPETLITNDANAVKAFHERTGGSTVYKMFNGTSFGLYGTRRLEPEDLDNLDRLKACPAIFQERIDGEYDVRAVVVGERVFAARLSFKPLTEIIDTRFVDTEVSEYALPLDVQERLVRFVAEFGLVYSAIDIRYSKKFGYVFFESNPEGQYLWLEIEANLAISHAIAERLLV
jgi:glutathione synthase/RimK-type ligase-like ATP-grasp enzyme